MDSYVLKMLYYANYLSESFNSLSQQMRRLSQSAELLPLLLDGEILSTDQPTVGELATPNSFDHPDLSASAETSLGRDTADIRP